ncbi:hypothetical protein COY52_12945 [Candidatus Desantisbacteria bacterium CG_4_10_14_0_8_um_filter_48_22]|uniref:Uncharacterized protein n=1 Tax=Candidatus Desantisbacteria bacterium CG_4_10_14_0_8_um_filter_48_22 TaxID=1974543 RepID=A0A2M7S4T2_9BACT|nr:MAG: hypothetical protein COS16_10890 [Candidatus Desantisbacteria bacterium CG02_land_8_20_14_3_00_49_13]PIZ14298.1 MAG: hypothetical protein COY52_12945 [Candidatus Desantisbacteria bacterium CG_4_10_14_0_8_um_filter_48_22]PJB27741.1 MAG: hypothetical protein CO111_03685 [Candidatus Desantisbacteria bacterium CG_4_9_14_3_um_filter_50_7]
MAKKIRSSCAAKDKLTGNLRELKKGTKMSGKEKLKYLTGMIITSFFSPNICRADVPLASAIFLVGFPFISVARTFGLAFAAIVLIEALALTKIAPVKLIKALGISLALNAFSTLFGFFYAIGYSGGLILLAAMIPGTIIFTKMLLTILKSIGKSPAEDKKLNAGNIAATFFALSFLVMFLNILTMPGHKMFRAPPTYTSIPEFIIAIIAGILLLIIGFVLTVIIEAYALVRWFPGCTDKPIRTAIKINIPSYIALLITSIFFFYRHIPPHF